jgi:hypothetical protein
MNGTLIDLKTGRIVKAFNIDNLMEGNLSTFQGKASYF